MTGQSPNDTTFTTEGFVAPPSGPPVILGVELTPIRMGIALGAIGVLGAGLLSFLQLKPIYDNIQTLEAQIDQKTAELRQVEQQVASFPEVPVIEQRLVAAQEANQQISRLLPSPRNIDTQLIDVTNLMQRSSTSLRSYIPSPPAPGGENVPAALASQIQVQNSTISMRGGYEEIIALMQNIERLETLLQVSNLSMQFDTANAPQLGATFNLTAYVYDEGVAASPITTDEATEGAAEGETEEETAN